MLHSWSCPVVYCSCWLTFFWPHRTWTQEVSFPFIPTHFSLTACSYTTVNWSTYFLSKMSRCLLQPYLLVLCCFVSFSVADTVHWTGPNVLHQLCNRLDAYIVLWFKRQREGSVNNNSSNNNNNIMRPRSESDLSNLSSLSSFMYVMSMGRFFLSAHRRIRVA